MTLMQACMMGDGKALQAGNSHNLGQNVSRENGQRCMANFLGSKHTHGGWHYTGLMLPPRTTPIWKNLNLAKT